jgi:hypothetical protein
MDTNNCNDNNANNNANNNNGLGNNNSNVRDYGGACVAVLRKRTSKFCSLPGEESCLT